VSAGELTPYERLMAEALPTGTFGDARPVTPRRRVVQPAPWTREEQEQHAAHLLAVLDEWERSDEYGTRKRERKRDAYAERKSEREQSALRLITHEPADQTAA
jgi:hypothetical protein